MRGLRRGIWLWLACMIASRGVTYGDELNGRPHLSMSAVAVETAEGKDVLRIRITYPPYRSGKSTMLITVPKELAVVSGELARETVAEVDTIGHPWFVKLRAKRPGRYSITGSVRMHHRDHIDEAEWELPVVVDRSGITAGHCEHTRMERVDESGRYRYAYEAMIPIEGPEPYSQDYIEKHGVKPRALESPVGDCAECVLALPAIVPCLVVVDKSGRVLSAMAVYRDLDPRLLGAAEAAVRKWRFAPAQVGAVTIGDWTGVNVVVR